MGVVFHFNTPVASILAADDRRTVTGLVTSDGATHDFDAIVAAADYHHVEQTLLPPQLRRHTPSYWAGQVMTPQTVVFMLCVAQPVTSLPGTHALWFDDMSLPFYAYSDVGRSWALPNQTSLFLLVPWLDISTPMPPRQQLLDSMLARLNIPREAVVCGEGGYGPSEWEANYHSFRGNAFGAANTLDQTMWLKVRARASQSVWRGGAAFCVCILRLQDVTTQTRRLTTFFSLPHFPIPLVLQPPLDSLASNLVFAGHLTHPGPGVPPALVSGIVAANLLHEQLMPVTLTSLAPYLVALAVLVVTTLLVRTSTVQNARALHRGGRTYFLAASAMPMDVFNRIAALYAVFRAADDIVDCTHVPPQQRLAELDAFEAKILETDVSRLGYPPDLWRRFFAAMRSDTQPGGVACKTTQELIAYMDGSAGE